MDILALNKDEQNKTSAQIEARLCRRYPESFVNVVHHPSFLSGKRSIRSVVGLCLHKVRKFSQYLSMKKFMLTNELECPKPFSKKVSKYITNRKYDIIYFNYAKIAPEHLPKGHYKTICDTHDVQFIGRHNYYRHAKKVHPLFSSLTSRIFKYSEGKALRRFDHTVAISPAEVCDFEDLVLGQSNIHCIPAFFDDTLFSEEATNLRYDLLFVGSPSAPNAFALLWFLEFIFPQILKEMPNVILCIAGKISNHTKIKMAATHHGDDIVRIDFVPKLKEVYAESKVVICPVFYGTGIKIKSVEALSMSCPVVGTSVAFDGINISDGINGMLADTPESFAQKIFLLLRDAHLRRTMRQGAHALFMEQHSRSSHIQKIKKLLDSITTED